LQPDVAFAHITRGSLILQLGLETEKQDLLRRAAEEYKLALASEPKNPLALADLGLAQLFLKQMEDAEQSLLAAIDASLALGAAGSRDNAFLAAAQLTLGHVHLSRKAYDKAESAYQRAKQSFEKNPFIHFSLAIALDNQKKKDAARIAARDARRLGLLPEYEGRLRDRGLLAGASPP
jgi:tetratricopeptide (TPR) repeat protein